jgi:hypothetical protein
MFHLVGWFCHENHPIVVECCRNTHWKYQAGNHNWKPWSGRTRMTFCRPLWRELTTHLGPRHPWQAPWRSASHSSCPVGGSTGPQKKKLSIDIQFQVRKNHIAIETFNKCTSAPKKNRCRAYLCQDFWNQSLPNDECYDSSAMTNDHCVRLENPKMTKRGWDGKKFAGACMCRHIDIHIYIWYYIYMHIYICSNICIYNYM